MAVATLAKSGSQTERSSPVWMRSRTPGVPPNPLPLWANLPLDCKLPVPPKIPKGVTALYTTRMGQRLWRSSDNLDFDLSDPLMMKSPGPTDYNALHDPFLASFMYNPEMQRHLYELGIITRDGHVQCTLRDLNRFRSYLHMHSLRRLYRKKDMTRKQVISQYQNMVLEHAKSERRISTPMPGQLTRRYSDILRDNEERLPIDERELAVEEGQQLTALKRHQLKAEDAEFSMVHYGHLLTREQRLEAIKHWLRQEHRFEALSRLRRRQYYEDKQRKARKKWRMLYESQSFHLDVEQRRLMYEELDRKQRVDERRKHKPKALMRRPRSEQSRLYELVPAEMIPDEHSLSADSAREPMSKPTKPRSRGRRRGPCSGTGKRYKLKTDSEVDRPTGMTGRDLADELDAAQQPPELHSDNEEQEQFIEVDEDDVEAFIDTTIDNTLQEISHEWPTINEAPTATDTDGEGGTTSASHSRPASTLPASSRAATVRPASSRPASSQPSRPASSKASTVSSASSCRSSRRTPASSVSGHSKKSVKTDIAASAADSGKASKHSSQAASQVPTQPTSKAPSQPSSRSHSTASSRPVSAGSTGQLLGISARSKSLTPSSNVSTEVVMGVTSNEAIKEENSELTKSFVKFSEKEDILPAAGGHESEMATPLMSPSVEQNVGGTDPLIGLYMASEAMETMLKSLAASDIESDAEALRAKHAETIERTRRLVAECEQHQVHRTASRLAEDVVNQLVRGVGQQLLLRDSQFKTADNVAADSPKYRTTGLTIPRTKAGSLTQYIIRNAITLADRCASEVSHQKSGGSAEKKAQAARSRQKSWTADEMAEKFIDEISTEVGSELSELVAAPSQTVVFLSQTCTNAIGRLYPGETPPPTRPESGTALKDSSGPVTPRSDRPATAAGGFHSPGEKSEGSAAGSGPTSPGGSSPFVEALINLTLHSELQNMDFMDFNQMLDLAGGILQTHCHKLKDAKGAGTPPSANRSPPCGANPHLSAALVSQLITRVLTRLLSALDRGELAETDLFHLASIVNPAASDTGKRGSGHGTGSRHPSVGSGKGTPEPSKSAAPPPRPRPMSSVKRGVVDAEQLRKRLSWVVSKSAQKHSDGDKSSARVAAAAEIFVRRAIDSILQSTAKLPGTPAYSQRHSLSHSRRGSQTGPIHAPHPPPTSKPSADQKKSAAGKGKGKTKPSTTTDEDEEALIDNELMQSSLALRARNSLELSRERLTRSRTQVSKEDLLDEAAPSLSNHKRRVSISDSISIGGSAPRRTSSGKVHAPLTKNFTVVIGEQEADKMAAAHPQGTSGMLKNLQRASEEDAHIMSMTSERDIDPEKDPIQIVPVLGQRSLTKVIDPEIVGEALAIISVKDHDELASDHVSKRNSYRNLHRPDMSALPWVQASVGSAEDVVVEKVRSFHASQKSLSSSGGIEEGSSRRAVETIHEEEVIQKEYVIDSTTVGGEESATKLGATEIPPEEGLTSGEEEEEEVEEEEEHEGLSDGAVQEPSPESPKRSTRPQPGVDFNSSAMPGSMSTVRTEFSKLYEFPEIEEMRLAAEAEAKMRSGASTPGVGGHPLRSAWSFEALQAAVTVADTVLVAAIRNVSESGQRTPAEALPRSELEYAAQVLTDDVMKFALRRVMTADEVERTRLRQHAVWPARAVRAATILTDDILNTAIRRWNDEQAWRDEILERSWSQKAISVANLVTKHILEAALHRVKSATDAVPALQSSRRHDPLWSEDALRAAILLTDDILSSAVLHINAGDGTGIHLSVQLPSEHPWTLDAIRAASKIVHSVLAEALEESFDAANPPLLAVSSTDEILAAALHQLQQQGTVDHTNVDHRLHGVSTLPSVHVPPAPRNTVEDEHHSQAFMPTYKPEDDILGFRRHSEETSVKTGSAHTANAETSVPSVSTTARSLSAEHPSEAVVQQPSGSARSGKVRHQESADHQPSATSSTHSLSAGKDAGTSRGPNDQIVGSPKDVGPADAQPMTEAVRGAETDVNLSGHSIASMANSLVSDRAAPRRALTNWIAGNRVEAASQQQQHSTVVSLSTALTEMATLVVKPWPPGAEDGKGPKKGVVEQKVPSDASLASTHGVEDAGGPRRTQRFAGARQTTAPDTDSQQPFSGSTLKTLLGSTPGGTLASAILTAGTDDQRQPASDSGVESTTFIVTAHQKYRQGTRQSPPPLPLPDETTDSNASANNSNRNSPSPPRAARHRRPDDRKKPNRHFFYHGQQLP